MLLLTFSAGHCKAVIYNTMLHLMTEMSHLVLKPFNDNRTRKKTRIISLVDAQLSNYICH